MGLRYALIQWTKVNRSFEADGETILSRFLVVETANLDYRVWDAVAPVARLKVEDQLMDLYVTHLPRSWGEDPLRQDQGQRFLKWIGTREDVAARENCGDFNPVFSRLS